MIDPSSLPTVIQRWGYRQARGTKLLFTLPAQEGLEKALCRQLSNVTDSSENHTVFEVMAEGNPNKSYYLYFVDGRMHICEGVIIERGNT